MFTIHSPPPQPDHSLDPDAVDATTLIILLHTISALGLNVRTYNSLRRDGIAFIGDLVSLPPKLKVPGLGKKSRREICAALAVHRLTLGMNLKNWQRPDSP